MRSGFRFQGLGSWIGSGLEIRDTLNFLGMGFFKFPRQDPFLFLDEHGVITVRVFKSCRARFLVKDRTTVGKHPPVHLREIRSFH